MEEEKQERGKLTERIKKKSFEMVGREIKQSELRLIPYIHYTMVNSQRLDPNKISMVERGILARWRKRGFITGGATQMNISREFWDYMNEMMFLGYVDID